MESAVKQEFTRRISQANSTEMVVILYEIALTYIREAGQLAEQGRGGDMEQFHLSISHARSCISELIASLHMEYAPAPEMYRLYKYCIRLLAVCEARQKAESLAEVTKILTALHDAYASVAHLNQDGPVMGNSQSVYAGLTYGRDSLNENMMGQVNRGFKA